MFRVWIGWSFCIALLAASPAAAQVSAWCKPVSDAMLKVVTTPHHSMSTETGRPARGEAITTADAMYVTYKGAWMKSPWTPAES
jgi:hypothetical protein